MLLLMGQFPMLKKMFNYLKVNFRTIGRQISIELLAIGISEQSGG
jgi:hypothetical protein